ncbi:hypothetical protein [Paraburkholderia terrae]|nr:hypothetical protein [Paraburkholderia terrae]
MKGDWKLLIEKTGTLIDLRFPVFQNQVLRHKNGELIVMKTQWSAALLVAVSGAAYAQSSV